MCTARFNPLFPDREMTIADEAINALNELAEQDGDVLARFQEGFNERSKLPELPEADGVPAGLPRVLAGLLRHTPPDVYLEPGSSAKTFNDQSFVAEFKSALIQIANRYPQTLLLLKKHQRQKNCSLADLLRAILLDYADNTAAYPY